MKFIGTGRVLRVLLLTFKPIVKFDIPRYENKSDSHERDPVRVILRQRRQCNLQGNRNTSHTKGKPDL